MQNDTLLKQRYRIIKTLGSGGFSVTYLARDGQTQRLCAVKHLSLAAIKDSKSVVLFEREAQVLAGLDHPSIPDFVDFFQEETADDINVYLVQEYIEGQNLAEMLKKGKRFSERQAVRIGIAVCRILAYLHGCSPAVIHRDIKPSNILMGADGNVYLIDFGAVRDRMPQGDVLDPTIVGTYGYMPIEQFGGNVVPASDIYSLGVTLIAVLCRREPTEIPQKKFRLAYQPLVNISRPLRRILDRMIHPEARQRYTTAARLEADLALLLQEPGSGTGRGKAVITLATVLLLALVIYALRQDKPQARLSPPSQATRPARSQPLPQTDEPMRTTPPIIHVTFDGSLEGRGLKPTFATADPGAIGFVAGKRGQAVHLLDGGIEYVETASHVFNNSYTLQFWFQVDAGELAASTDKAYYSVLRSALLSFDIRRAGESFVFVHGAAGGHMQMNLHDRNSPLVTGRWYHIAIVRRATDGRMDLYLDGQPVANLSRISMPLGDMFDVLKLGVVRHASNASFRGTLDELEVFDYARTPEQIQAGIAVAMGGESIPIEAYEVSGRLFFDGQPLTEFTDEAPRFWFRNEGTGREQTVRTSYADGRFYFHDLQPGRYGVDISVRARADSSPRAPGTFKTWKVFSILDQPGGELALHTHRLIHLLKPQDNAQGLERWDAQCEGKIDFASPVLLQWEPVIDHALYTYKIERWSCRPFRKDVVLAEGSTAETFLQADLPRSQSNEMLVFTLSAAKNGHRVGLLETYGKVGGRGWDYRFRVR